MFSSHPTAALRQRHSSCTKATCEVLHDEWLEGITPDLLEGGYLLRGGVLEHVFRAVAEAVADVATNRV